MTRFVESFTTRHMLPPWSTRRSRSWLFLAALPRDKVIRYLDKFMNSAGPDRAPYHYEPWSETCFGFLTLVEHGHFSSESSDETLGFSLKHSELIWTFPAARYRKTEDNLLVERQLVWVQPFYFDDNSYVTFSSREIWGGEKGMADVLVAEGSNARDFHMDVDLHGFSTYSPRSQVHAIGGIHIRGGPVVPEDGERPGMGDPGANGAPGAPSSTVGQPIPELDDIIAGDKDLLAFLKSFEDILPDDWSIEHPTRNFRVPGIEINSVKQYRDANDTRLAAYRAIVSSLVTHSNLLEFDYLPRERVDVRFMWSATFREQLENLFGLKAPPDGQGVWGHVGEGLHIDDIGVDWNLPAVKLDVHLALHFHADAHFEVKKVLHAYGNSPLYPVRANDGTADT